LALLRLDAGAAALAAVGEAWREVLRAAWRALRAADERTRTQTLALWQAEALSAKPEGLLHLHPSWSEEALAGERSEVVAAVQAAPAASGTIPPETTRELARLAFAWLAPLCESAAGPLAERLCRLEPAALVTELTRRGARVVGRSLAGAAPVLRARAMAAAGEPWAQEIAAAFAEKVSRDECAAAGVFANAVATADERTPRERLLAVGLAALEAELVAEAPGSVLRVAGRLPAPLGRVLVGW
jgi:hypothetical protein